MSLPLTTMADPTTCTPDAAPCSITTCNDPPYLLSDHLGSTSTTTDVEGNLVSEMRYKPWGEVRHASGLTPTDYTYTDQYSYMDDPTTSASEGFGLMFYNARWYDPSLGRFAQADTIVPLASQGTQAWDRYTYTNNNPVKYTDPSGHCAGPLMVFCFIVGVIAISVSIDLVEQSAMEMNAVSSDPRFREEQVMLQQWQDNCMGQCHYAHTADYLGSTGPMPESP